VVELYSLTLSYLIKCRQHFLSVSLALLEHLLLKLDESVFVSVQLTVCMEKCLDVMVSLVSIRSSYKAVVMQVILQCTKTRAHRKTDVGKRIT